VVVTLCHILSCKSPGVALIRNAFCAGLCLKLNNLDVSFSEGDHWTFRLVTGVQRH
jgi:hypothetical protein